MKLVVEPVTVHVAATVPRASLTITLPSACASEAEPVLVEPRLIGVVEPSGTAIDRPDALPVSVNVLAVSPAPALAATGTNAATPTDIAAAIVKIRGLRIFP